MVLRGMDQDAKGFSPEHVIEWAASPAADASPPVTARPFGARPFTAVTMSSRPDGWPQMRPGGLFVAVRGDRRDGHDFVADAFANGAIAALVDHVPAALAADVSAGRIAVVSLGWTGPEGLPEVSGPCLFLVDPATGTVGSLQRLGGWWRRRWGGRVVAIAGSVGKTTTKDLVAAILRRRFRSHATAGNLNNELGLPITLLGLDGTHEVAAVEIGISAPGEMATFAGIAAPDVAVMTRIEAEHLEFLRDLETVEREEGTLVASLGASGVAVLNADDPRVAAMASRTSARVATFGTREQATTRAARIEVLGLEGTRFRLLHEGHERDVRLPLAGRHFVGAALAAAAAGFAVGCDWDDVVAGLEAPPASPRVRVVQPRRGLTLIDDTYNASPASCFAALDLLDEAAVARGARRVAILGDMLELGEAAVEAHAQVGAYARDRVDALIAVGEESRETARVAVASGMDARDVAWVPRAGDAADAFDSWRHATDNIVVLVKGSRGMRMEEATRALADRGEPAPSGPRASEASPGSCRPPVRQHVDAPALGPGRHPRRA